MHAVLNPRTPLQAVHGGARAPSGSHGITVRLSDRVSATTAPGDTSPAIPAVGAAALTGTHAREQPIGQVSLNSASSGYDSSNNRERSAGPCHYPSNAVEGVRLHSSTLLLMGAAADVAHVAEASDVNAGHALLHKSSSTSDRTSSSLQDSAIDFPPHQTRVRGSANADIREYALQDGCTSVTSDETEHRLTHEHYQV